jgi:uncharacterized membrane protein (DUF373 family)
MAMRRPLLGRWEAVRIVWPTLTIYQRFESLVATMLTLIISIVILVALYRLLVDVFTILVIGVLNPLEHTVFQAVFGEIMTLLIALEFNHTLQYVVNRAHSIIQTKIVLLIALLAVARKVIILDLQEMEAGAVLGLAAVILVLGMTYWLIREQDDRMPGPNAGASDKEGRPEAHDLPGAAQRRSVSTAMEQTTTT